MSVADETTEFTVPRRTFTIEFFVGLFMLLGLGCFAFIAINIARMRFFDTGFYEVKAMFSNISGLEKGAPVELAGVPIGEVKKIDLQETQAIVTLSVRDGVPLREDDIASVRTKGIIGDRYVRITPGASDKTVGAGGEIDDTESTVDIEEIIGKFIHSMASTEKSE
jgi:phospholipid/cholesterol/gamma-HCH transport system substrate-binding protein